MICPLSENLNDYGSKKCIMEDCVWGDSTLNQCCIKTLVFNSIFVRIMSALASTDEHLNYPFNMVLC